MDKVYELVWESDEGTYYCAGLFTNHPDANQYINSCLENNIQIGENCDEDETIELYSCKFGVGYNLRKCVRRIYRESIVTDNGDNIFKTIEDEEFYD